MRFIKLLIIFLVSLPVSASEIDGDLQVRINGKVALMESVISYCGGDTLLATSISSPLPVSSSYLTEARISIEKLYNRLDPNLICMVLGVMALMLTLFGKTIFLKINLALLFCAFIFDFALNWYLSGYLPLMTISDTCGAIAVLLSGGIIIAYKSIKSEMLPVLTAVLVILCVVCIFYGEHPAVRMVNPALASVWLSVHVPVIIGSYALFFSSAVAAAFGNVGKKVRFCVIAGEILLGVGIICGALWAREAWGRLWAWDPKETAALVTFLIYLLLISVWNVFHKKPSYLRVIICGAFIAVIITWFFINKGLHSY